MNSVKNAIAYNIRVRGRKLATATIVPWNNIRTLCWTPHTPRLVLVIDDGFSRSFLHAHGLADQAVTGYLLPPPDSAMYLPGEHDNFTRRPLRLTEQFPRLADSWNKFCDSNPRLTSPREKFRSFCRERESEAGSSDRNGPLEGTCFYDTVDVQFRFYLWFLFKWYNGLIDRAIRNDFNANWPWNAGLKKLAIVFDLAVISFNYDLVCERSLDRYSTGVNQNMQALRMKWLFQPAVIKPHGSIALSIGQKGLDRMWGDNPWLGDAVLSASDLGVRFDPSLIRNPFAPDIVPPGHAGKHLWNFRSDATDAAHEAIRSADAVLVCGLSGDEPDTAEVDQLLSQMQGRVPAYQIDLEDGRERPTTKALKRFSGEFQFFEARERGVERAISEIICRHATRDNCSGVGS